MEEKLRGFTFTNGRRITKSMLIWWAFQNPRQGLLDTSDGLHVEHIFARKRAEVERSLKAPESLESLGNKAVLEDQINIRASDYRFSDKKRYYLGFTDNRGRAHAGTAVAELAQLAREHEDFTETNIQERSNLIIRSFLDSLGELDLLVRDAPETHDRE